MEKLRFSITINAPREKVWEVLWDEDTYPQWTSIFSEGSHALSDWQEGSRVLFLNAKGDGMYSRIDKRVDHSQMSFTHLGEVIKGTDQLVNEQDREWAGATENYYLNEAEGGTELKVEMDATDDFKGYFEETFPKALALVKDLAERPSPPRGMDPTGAFGT